MFWWLLLLVFTCGCGEAAIEASYSLAESLLLGVDLTYARVNLLSDQNVYFRDGMPCRRVCNENVPDCPRCDYTSQDVNVCGKVGCGCTEQMRLKSCSYGNWTFLKPGDKVEQSFVPVGQPAFYRVYVDNPCAALKFNFSVRYGNINVFASFSEPSPDVFRQDIQQRTIGTQLSPLYICPQSYAFNYGTLFVGVYSTSRANYTLQYETEDFEPEPQKTKDPDLPCNLHPNATDCLQNGVPSYDYVTEMSLFQYTTDHCEEIHIFAEILEKKNLSQRIIFFFDYAPFAFRDTTNKNSVFDTSDWFLQLCPEDFGVSEITLFIGLFAPDCRAGIVVETRPDLWETVLVREFLRRQFLVAPQLFGSVQLVCEDKNYTCYSGLLSGTCVQFFVGIPFRRRIAALGGVDDRFNNILFNFEDLTFIEQENSDLNPQSFMPATIILSYKIDGKETEVVSNWKTNLSTCSVIIPPETRLMGQDGKYLRGSHPLRPEVRNKTCDVLKFQELFTKFQSLIEAISFAPYPSVAIWANYALNALTFTHTYNGCRFYLDSFFLSEPTELDIATNDCLAIPGSAEYATDPCCNDTLQWEQCCATRLRKETFPRYFRAESSNNCRAPKCVDFQLDLYEWFFNYNSGTNGCQGVLNDEVILLQRMQYYVNCQQKYYGTQSGLSCESDDDCVFGCNYVLGKCFIPEPETSILFFKCLEDNMTVDSRLYLLSFFGKDIFDSLLPIFMEKYRATQCIGSTGPAEGFFPVVRRYADGCTFYDCYDVNCALPLAFQFQTTSRRGGACSFIWVLVPPDFVGCGQYGECNWNKNLGKEDCERGAPYFCGSCSGNSSCTVLPLAEGLEVSTKEQCENAVGCKLASGEIILVKSD